MEIELLSGTTENPLSTIGERAGLCWNSPINDKEKNVKRAVECIKSGHGRTLEFVNIELVLSNASARVMREVYTHIGGAPTRLQSSTRYVSEQKGFEYFEPKKISDNLAAKTMYTDVMSTIQNAYNGLVEAGIPVEDAANVLPLGMNSKMILKCNLRMLINFCNQRLCHRAYHEIRKFTQELVKMLKAKNDEWKWIAENLLVPKCEIYKYLNENLCFCQEKFCCGKHQRIDKIQILK